MKKRRLPWLLTALLLAGCTSLPPKPKNINNVCEIFRQNPTWYRAAKKSQKKWGIPLTVQMAIVRYESDFTADARPPRRKLLGFIPWSRVSTAYGYSQALDGTWEGYQHDNKRYFADRDDFTDAIDFVGWYANHNKKYLNLKAEDAYALYLAYHEGAIGYKQGTYWKKRWLRSRAQLVLKRSKVYQKQLAMCESSLKKQSSDSENWWWF